MLTAKKNGAASGARAGPPLLILLPPPPPPLAWLRFVFVAIGAGRPSSTHRLIESQTIKPGPAAGSGSSSRASVDSGRGGPGPSKSSVIKPGGSGADVPRSPSFPSLSISLLVASFPFLSSVCKPLLLQIRNGVRNLAMRNARRDVESIDKQRRHCRREASETSGSVASFSEGGGEGGGGEDGDVISNR